MNITISDDKYIIRFNYDPEDVQWARSLQGSRWNPTEKMWTAARTVPNAIEIKAQGYLEDAEILSAFDQQTSLGRRYFRGDYKWDIRADLLQHQKEWQEWCKTRPRALCVAEVGLGKTLMSLLWLNEFGVPPEQVIVIAPASLLFNWVSEVAKFAFGVSPLVVAGGPAKKNDLMLTAAMHVINYEALTAKEGKIKPEVENLLKRKTAVIWDEFHYCKGPSSNRSKAAHKIHDIVPNILGLTGTPVTQGAQDYYSQFKALESRLLGPSFLGFKNRYCIQEAVRGAPAGVMRITGYRRMEELTRIIAPYTFTRLKKDCLNLPEKMYNTIRVEMGKKQRKAYQDMKKHFVLWVKDGLEPITQTNFLARMMKLCQISQGFATFMEHDEIVRERFENPKLDALLDFIEGLGGREQVIVMCRFRQDVASIVAALKAAKIPCDEVHGDISYQDGSRHEVADRFQRREFQVLVAQVNSISHGFTLTCASHMVFFSNDFNLNTREQAEGRIHRHGQEKSVLYTDILCAGTYDEDIYNALISKRSVADALTEMRKQIAEEI